MDGSGATMNHLGTMYATKRRRRNSKTVRVPPKEGQTKSNPSKRHRERLNAELDTLASLLPFDQNVLSKLDKLSILRLSVSYLRTKSYFQAALNRDPERTNGTGGQERCPLKQRDHLYTDHHVEGDMILQALNGFLLILTCEGEVFYTSHTVETYLGFHQSDICHQSVYELVHSEDREELQRHLTWNAQLPSDRSAISLQEALLPENSQILERNFTVRFRCLLDNTSGFLRLDIRGRIKVLHGQNHKTEEPPLALFALCTPFGPPSLLEMPQKDAMFKSKHKLDLSLVSLDQRAKQVLGYSDSELANKGGYDLVHYDDLSYVASAHQELLKTGASGLIAYRLISKTGNWQWLQTSARLVYKNSKPDFILCTHRPLMEEEGRDLLGKRTMDFKVTYLDGNLNSMSDRSGLLSDTDFVMRCQRTRRYKSQIRDILTTCKKRKSPVNGPAPTAPIIGGAIADPCYVEDAAAVAAAASAAAAVAGYNNVYPYADNVNGIANPYATAAMPQNLFTAAIDNTRFLAAENFLHYRPLSTYYPDYTVAQYPGNGFLDVTGSAPTRTCFANSFSGVETLVGATTTKDDNLYQCQMEGPSAKFNGNINNNGQAIVVPKTVTSCCDTYSPINGETLRNTIVSPLHHGGDTTPTSQPLLPSLERDLKIRDYGCGSSNNNMGFAFPPSVTIPTTSDVLTSSVVKPLLKPGMNGTTGVLMTARELQSKNDHSKPKVIQQQMTPYSIENNRQSVVMWNNGIVTTSNNDINRCPNTAPTAVNGVIYETKLPRYHQEEAVMMGSPCKWSGSAATPKSASPHNSTSPASGKVAPQVTYGNTPYTQDMVFELPMVRVESSRGPTVKQEGNNPLLSISEVTNTLLDHQ